MLFDFDLIEKVYKNYDLKISEARKILNRPLTLTEKILYAHLAEAKPSKSYVRGKDYADFDPDRVAMQDATAQMALLQFMHAGRKRVAVPTSVHCDHLIVAKDGAEEDVKNAKIINKEVYDFLYSVSNKYGIGFWQPGSGIIHQIILENYAFPGGMIIGTDSHTVNAGGMCMIAIGVGGADAVDVMVGMPWELKFPKIIGIRLTGKLNGWTSPKDIILKIAGLLTVKGGTGHVIEYFGPGASTLSCTGKATICNMGAEVGATTSIFGYDEHIEKYLIASGREKVAKLANTLKNNLMADPEVFENPEKYYDQVIEIDLSSLEPHINGPFTPDKAFTISEFAQTVQENDYPEKLDVALIGSCTNSSFEDLSRSVSVLRQMKKKGLTLKSELIITPGSEMVRSTIEKEGILDDFKYARAKIMANACGPCIGQWSRLGADNGNKNSIVTTFNRNFSKRNDGNPNTYAFITSPELAVALAIAGKITFNPLKDKLVNEKGENVLLDPPCGEELPASGFQHDITGYIPPAVDGTNVQVIIDPNSQRLQLLEPFSEWDGKEIIGLRILIKVKGKCTTDHISMAGPWLKYRGHLDKISDNLLIGATNAYNDKINSVKNYIINDYISVPESARIYKKNNVGTIVIGDENYGEGSSREHAAMEPRYLGIKAVIAKSFARIHETNLKKQGVLALTFADKDDYNKILEDDVIDIIGLINFDPSKQLKALIHHSNGKIEEIYLNHSYNISQFEWFKAGSALNLIKKKSIG